MYSKKADFFVRIVNRQKAITELENKLSSAWKFVGERQVLPTGNDLTNYTNGDIIVIKTLDDDGKLLNTIEYAFDGKKFIEIGSDQAYMATYA